MTTLKALGFPTIEEVNAVGMNGPQFYDVVMWLQLGKKRLGDGWLRRPTIVTGREALAFISEVSR